MSLFKVFDVSSSALSAQSVRLNLVASNLANAESAGTTPESTYRARHPVFQAELSQVLGNNNAVGVKVSNIVQSSAPPQELYAPENPLANEAGYVFMPNVNAIEEMANMISASRSYQSNVEVMNTAKQLLARTLQLGQ